MKRLLKLMFGDWAEIKLVLFVAIILFGKLYFLPICWSVGILFH